MTLVPVTRASVSAASAAAKASVLAAGVAYGGRSAVAASTPGCDGGAAVAAEGDGVSPSPSPCAWR
jgi:hypothetical protein